jgi:hypothetical protein
VKGKRPVVEERKDPGGHPDIIGDHFLLGDRNTGIHHFVKIREPYPCKISKGWSFFIPDRIRHHKKAACTSPLKKIYSCLFLEPGIDFDDLGDHGAHPAGSLPHGK